MSLVSAQFNGNNYLTWARSVKIALGAKQKLGYIDGSYVKPTEDKEAIERWQRNDYMVVSWILSSISKEIAEAFLYTNSAKDLWTNLETRFGESNGPLLYQIQREITSITQKNSTVAVYFTKLKKLWDELGSLDPLPVCTCGASKKMSEKITSQKLIQFLMGLGDTYEQVKNQILLMDPLPTTAKACSMVHRIEKQMEVNFRTSEVGREGVMAVQVAEIKGQENVKMNFKKGTTLDKKHLQCDHCKKKGHVKEGCFELVGYPEWYKNMMDQRKIGSRPTTARTMNSRVNYQANNLWTSLNGNPDSDITDLIRKEMHRSFKNKTLAK
ncbi:uncharacterized protein LOC110012136 [Sesamum indicum]|uniref:Uncharacterized protein LOC110012136 n=1 Tax=Sesamum indicum TaxID=4182 RepID=A0A8M8UTM8_SESIN|nr:uncharacterized protein LOC110012136 [Sesamum indicum]